MRGRGLRTLGLVVAGAAVVFAVVLASRFGTDPGLVDSPLLGRASTGVRSRPTRGWGECVVDRHAG